MVKINLNLLCSTVVLSGFTFFSSLVFPSLIAAQETITMENKQLKNRVGRFTLNYQPSRNKLHQALQTALQQSGIFESIIDDLNNSGLVMRVDIPVVFADCGLANASYQPSNNSITICNELIFEMAEDFMRHKNIGEEEALTDAVYTTIFVFYHELGHALIDVLPLPAVGREEDAVDQFSAMILLNSGSDTIATKTILNAALWFGTNPDIPAWDEHAPNQVRFYDLVCLVYGSAPDNYTSLLEILPQERAVRCPSEYARVSKSWSQLLIPHFANANKPWGNVNPAGNPNPPASGTRRRGRIW